MPSDPAEDEAPRTSIGAADTRPVDARVIATVTRGASFIVFRQPVPGDERRVGCWGGDALDLPERRVEGVAWRMGSSHFYALHARSSFDNLDYH